MALKLITGPAAEPLSLSEAKAFLRLEHTEDDALVTAIITAARRYIEAQTWRALINQTWELTMDGFPANDAPFRLAKGTIQSVTSITYRDTAGDSQTLDAGSYQVDTDTEHGRVALEPSASWPHTEVGRLNAVRVRFVAGYGPAASSVPGDLLQAMRMLVAQLYENRSPEVIGTITAQLGFSLSQLLAPHRAVRF